MVNIMLGNLAAQDNEAFQGYQTTRKEATISGQNTCMLSPTFRSLCVGQDS